MHVRPRFVYVRHDKKAIRSLKDWLSLYRFVLRYNCQVQGIILVPGFFVIFGGRYIDFGRSHLIEDGSRHLKKIKIPRLSMDIRAVLTLSTVCAETLQLLKGQVLPGLCSKFHASSLPKATVHSPRSAKLLLEALGMHLALEVVGSWTETRCTVVIIRKTSGACLCLLPRIKVRCAARRNVLGTERTLEMGSVEL